MSDYTADRLGGKDALRHEQGVPSSGPPVNPKPLQLGQPLEAPTRRILRFRLVRLTWPQGAGASWP